jgi:hypothetical protein
MRNVLTAQILYVNTLIEVNNTFHAMLLTSKCSESYTKNDSHNYGDSNHSITLEDIVNYDSHRSFWGRVCTRLVANVIWEPYATGVRVWKVAG